MKTHLVANEAVDSALSFIDKVKARLLQVKENPSLLNDFSKNKGISYYQDGKDEFKDEEYILSLQLRDDEISETLRLTHEISELQPLSNDKK